MDFKQLADAGREKLAQYLSKSSERLILLQSTGLASVAMLASYAYGQVNYTPKSYDCPPIQPSLFMQFDASRCTEVPAVVIYPEPWMSMLLVGTIGTVFFGMIATTLDRSVFARYLLAGWLAFCAVVAVSGYFNYSSMGRFPGAYFVVYPATTVVAFGVAAACAAAIANVVLRIKGTPTTPAEAG
ncbi:hypothetical protein HFN59_02390 [Rhizobium leguminosarum]|uniref:hypothetical protein n=1 Tax=Rhizobium leguminosarum TaxID=384 RepID=UPI001C943924|nr:hypothetical protein [Rhizobium leguminosarum]MBY5775973.1 hypothetical protein [Rhizobium leguminosarum]